jgi:type I restriction enzyme, S subunit
MNPERLLQHFERISEAPDAIPRLRRFILDLAVRGKLVEQDPNDEPASSQLALNDHVRKETAQKDRRADSGEGG